MNVVAAKVVLACLGVKHWLISEDNRFSQARYLISNTAPGLMPDLISIHSIPDFQKITPVVISSINKPLSDKSQNLEAMV